MPLFTVLIPTHDHADTLVYSIASVQKQTLQDFELFVVGDGAPARTKELLAELIKQDQRIRYFENSKGQRHGELHRHSALAEANGAYVAYLPDDDLWAPEHLECLSEGLKNHDLVHTMHIGIRPERTVNSRFFDARVPADLAQMRRSANGFGLGTAAHSLQAYRRLPFGWRPAPVSMNTDIYFWLQFLGESWCRYLPIFWPTLFHFSSKWRDGHALEARVEELSEWSRNLDSRDFRDLLIRTTMQAIVVAEHRAAVGLENAGTGKNYTADRAISFPGGNLAKVSGVP